jgi:paspaline synthase
VYGLVYPPNAIAAVISTTWLVIDLGLVYVTLKFGAGEWHHAPLVARNLPAILSIECLALLVLHLSFVRLFDDDDILPSCFWSAYSCQISLGWSALAQLVSRGHTRGHSIVIW